ncbi:MAG: ZIP family metal transporter [Thermoproteota archaeon]|nr:MAG: ZIP family metal transporter [Candidatus Korarchaeota archaeon]
MLSDNLILLGSIASLFAGLFTAVGALPIFFTSDISDKFLDAALGFSAGVMLAASSFSLLVPAIEMAGIGRIFIGLLGGAIFVDVADRLIPHEHMFKGYEGPPSRLSKVSLMILAITIHNFPEGMAVGVSFGGGDISSGLAVSVAIALQNIPEGMAVAFPMLREGFKKRKAAWYATLSGLIEPVGGLLGISLVSTIRPILPIAMAFAAGAMIFVVSDEMIPESHSRGYERIATFGAVMGFAVMMFLDNLFG